MRVKKKKEREKKKMHKIDAVHHRIGYKLIILFKIFKKNKERATICDYSKRSEKPNPKVFVLLFVCMCVWMHLFIYLNYLNYPTVIGLVRHLDPKVCLFVGCVYVCFSVPPPPFLLLFMLLFLFLTLVFPFLAL